MRKDNLKYLVLIMTLSRQQVKDLQLIKTCPKALRKKLLKNIPSRSVKAICECTLNVLKGNVPLTTSQKRYLSKYKSTLRKIGTKKGSLSSKRNLIVQKGGFLNILLPAALSVLTTLINGAR